MLEENFRRALLLSRGDLVIFVERPISAFFLGACALVIVFQFVSYLQLLRTQRDSTALGNGAGMNGVSPAQLGHVALDE